jgi:hypothetical protein
MDFIPVQYVSVQGYLGLVRSGGIYRYHTMVHLAGRYGQQILNCPTHFFSTLVPTVVQTFGKTYTELISAQDTIIEILQEEEQSFTTMLQRGIKYLYCFYVLFVFLPFMQHTVTTTKSFFYQFSFVLNQSDSYYSSIKLMKR